MGSDLGLDVSEVVGVGGQVAVLAADHVLQDAVVGHQGLVDLGLHLQHLGQVLLVGLGDLLGGLSLAAFAKNFGTR